jgi:hypothetical protein
VFIAVVGRVDSDDGPESEDEEEGNEMLNVVSKPFQGVIVCFTGVKDKVTICSPLSHLVCCTRSG